MENDFDVPASRGYDWEKRAKEIKERDEGVCQRCGDHNGNYEYFPVSMEVHHIVPGKYLPKSDARVGLNLVTVCSTCHGRLEGSHVERQLAETGRDNALQILNLLKSRRQNMSSVSRKVEFSEDSVRILVDQLKSMNCVTNPEQEFYEAICPATFKSVVEKRRIGEKAEKKTPEVVQSDTD